MLERLWENLLGRLDGPMHFRIVMQPVMASIFALLAGIRDARAGVRPYLWKALTLPEHRGHLLRDGWKSIRRVFVLAVVLDLVYQVTVLKHVYPGEIMIVAVLLAVVPFALLRGPFHRLVVLLGVRPRVAPNPPVAPGPSAPPSPPSSHPSASSPLEPPRA